MNTNIRLAHGSGGKLMHELIQQVFLKHFDQEVTTTGTDSAIWEHTGKYSAFTTDSFVVDPLFFPGGNIGKLAVCGTVNDLAVAGAQPEYLSAGFIIEEGFPLADLEKIVQSMSEEAKKAGIKIVTGDTKVVHKHKADKLFINTSGIGTVDTGYRHISTGVNIKPGDVLIINGSLGDHAMAILAAREEFSFETDIQSDCACLNYLIHDILRADIPVKFMRDLTRGGLATCANELVGNSKTGIEIDENKIPVKEHVRGLCELLGFDPLYLANEGKVMMVVPETYAEQTLEVLKKSPYGKNSAVIGKITSIDHGKVIMNSLIGGRRILPMLTGEQLPRIC